MYEIAGKPMIWWVIQSIKRAKSKTKIVVATSKNKTDDKLYNFLTKLKINVFRGSLNNVADRLNKTAEKYNSKYFVRICGDSPLIDSSIIDKIILIYKKKKDFDIISNIFPIKIFPKGMSVELIKTSILKNNIYKMSKNEKEHVTKYFYKNNTRFNIISFFSFFSKKMFDYKKISYAVDSFNDLKKLKPMIIKKFKL